MGIKEKDLQTVESLNTGDFLRVVTADGKSRKVDKDAVGGGSGGEMFRFKLIKDSATDKWNAFAGGGGTPITAKEITEAFESGKKVIADINSPLDVSAIITEAYSYEYASETRYRVISAWQFTRKNASSGYRMVSYSIYWDSAYNEIYVDTAEWAATQLTE